MFRGLVARDSKHIHGTRSHVAGVESGDEHGAEGGWRVNGMQLLRTWWATQRILAVIQRAMGSH